MTLSLCMIVKDEEAQLSRCLSSVQGFVDERVIVDTGSTDKTCEIAQQFQAQVYEFDWCDDFAAARNYALQQVKTDWVLVLDADEVLVPEIQAELLEALQSPHLLLLTFLREEVGAAQAPISAISRLFRNHPGLYFKRPYHELIDDSVQGILIKEPHWHIGELNRVAIQHVGYQSARIQQQDKQIRAQRMLEKGIQQYPQDAYLYAKLGGLYVDLGDGEKAIATLNQGLGQAPEEAAVQYELAYHLGLAYQHMNEAQKSEMAYKSAIALPLPPVLKIGAFINLGSLYLENKAFKLARQLFSHVTQVMPSLAIAHYNLGLALKSLYFFAEAEQAYQQALALNPGHAPSLQNLGVVLYKMGRGAESLKAFEGAIALYEESDPPEAERLREGIQELGLI